MRVLLTVHDVGLIDLGMPKNGKQCLTSAGISWQTVRDCLRGIE